VAKLQFTFGWPVQSLRKRNYSELKKWMLRKLFCLRNILQLLQFKILFMLKKIRLLTPIALVILLTTGAFAQESKQMVRLARLVIDSTQLESYRAFLKEEIETSLRVESGVLTLYAVAEKNNPLHITILEIYANEEAYNKHIQTPHFLKYKNGTKDMVKSLELIEADPLIPTMKVK